MRSTGIRRACSAGTIGESWQPISPRNARRKPLPARWRTGQCDGGRRVWRAWSRYPCVLAGSGGQGPRTARPAGPSRALHAASLARRDGARCTRWPRRLPVSGSTVCWDSWRINALDSVSPIGDTASGCAGTSLQETLAILSFFPDGFPGKPRLLVQEASATFCYV